MLITPDFSEIADAVTAGTYTAVIKGMKTGEWQTGTKYINWELETVNEADPKNNGRRIFMKTPVAGRGAFRLQELCRAALGTVPTQQLDTEALMGKTVVVEVVDAVDQSGEKTGYTDVKRVKRANS